MKIVNSSWITRSAAGWKPNRAARFDTKTLFLLGIAGSLMLIAGVAKAQYGQYQQQGQYPLLDKAANKVIQKYQNSSCEQLWQERNQPKPAQEQRVVDFLRSDPQMRRMFIDRIAAPVANKMFECGMIP